MDAFTGESNGAFDDVLILDVGVGLTGKTVAIAAVGEDDNLAAIRDEFLAHEVGDRNRETVNDDTVARVQSVFHAGADDVVATKN